MPHKSRPRRLSYLREYRETHPDPRTQEQHKDRKWEWRLKQFGLTPEKYEEMFVAQGGVCAICGATPGARRLAVDHDHNTDEVRGLLCGSCNVWLGWIKDAPQVIQKALAYLGKVV